MQVHLSEQLTINARTENKYTPVTMITHKLPSMANKSIGIQLCEAIHLNCEFYSIILRF